MNKDSNQEIARMIRNKMKEKWGKLTDEEISLYRIKPSEFYQKLKEKYSISRDDAEALIQEFEAASKLRKVA